MIKAYLTLIGIAYAGLAIWCAAKPLQTAESVGFRLSPGSGQSEYLTVYGGLQFGMAIIFLGCWWRADLAMPALFACIAIHGCLVVFRAISFALFRDIGTTTYVLAGLEWLIFLGGIGVLLFARKPDVTPAP
ncbi:MAG: hypothetical protein AB7N71_14620 [Phycisphaerae bacterium]